MYYGELEKYLRRILYIYSLIGFFSGFTPGNSVLIEVAGVVVVVYGMVVVVVVIVVVGGGISCVPDIEVYLPTFISSNS